eukprot:TRINITY_DN42921_c0_g1_i2.p2 TRINITY_DN42921_c0_g1~~TRINITY_DN42921_c0_g1_i2.p2  ORF type:complete len:172 (-),score=24.12 TRINITY_DN42921_c0_g1_i2:23-538(-)
MVLLWSLQYKTVLAFLVSDQGAGYRLDAVHYGIALFFHNMLESGGLTDTGFQGEIVNVGALIQDYGKRIKGRRQYQNSNELSLAYYMLAADIYYGDSTDKEMKLEKQSDMLYEFIASGDAYGYLFSGGGSLLTESNNPLVKYIQNVDDRQKVLEQVATAFHRNAKHSQSVA